MSLYLHDTMTGEKRRFEPRDPDRVTMYVCGPTVYNYSHIGNFRPVVAFDLLHRLLRRLYGPDHVVYAANITDVDDKINAKAAQEGVPIATITNRYLDAYHEDTAALCALPPTFEPRATQTIDAIIDMIARLVRNNAAYAAEGHVLFNTEACTSYGALSGRPLEDMIAGARVDVAPYKRNPADFVLWKPSKPGEPEWPSPFGPGRPGWHIECSAMIEQTLGFPIDIHGGGIDLVFPHHENERAQGVCAGCGPVYASFWLHNGFLNFGDEKMSKSLGNVVLAHELVKATPGEAVRWALLSGHYRQPLEWTGELLAQAKRSLDRLYGALRRASDVEAAPGDPPEGLLAALCDDLNTPKAFAELFAAARALETAEGPARARAKAALLAGGRLMGFLSADPDAWFEGGADADFRGRVEALISARTEARARKDWAEADRIRDALKALDVVVMDGPAGPEWRRGDGA